MSHRCIYADSLGYSTANDGGTTVAAGTSGSKGSDVSLGSPSQDIVGFDLVITGTSSFDQFAVDVKIGSSSPETVLENVVVGRWSSGANNDLNGVVIPCPFPVPSGEDIQIAAATSHASARSVYVMVRPWLDHPLAHLGTQRCTTYGYDGTQVLGQSVTPGTSGEGSWVELDSSIANPVKFLMLNISTDEDLAALNQQGALAIGIGAAASEEVVVDRIPYQIRNSNFICPRVALFPGVHIDAGERLAVRARADSATALFVHALAFG